MTEEPLFMGLLIYQVGIVLPLVKRLLSLDLIKGVSPPRHLARVYATHPL